VANGTPMLNNEL